VRLFREASVRVFVHATEDEEKVKGALLSLLPPGSGLVKGSLRGHFGNPILTLDARITDPGKVEEMWGAVLRGLPREQLRELLEGLEERMEGCTLYLRLDKQLASQGRISLTEGGDAIHVRLRAEWISPSPQEEIRRQLLEAEKAEK